MSTLLAPATCRLLSKSLCLTSLRSPCRLLRIPGICRGLLLLAKAWRSPATSRLLGRILRVPGAGGGLLLAKAWRSPTTSRLLGRILDTPGRLLRASLSPPGSCRLLGLALPIGQS